MPHNNPEISESLRDVFESSLQELKKRHRHLVLLKGDDRHILAQAYGFYVAGKLPVVVGSPSLIAELAVFLSEMSPAMALNMKVVIYGRVSDETSAERPKTVQALESVLRLFLDDFGLKVISIA